MVKEFFKAGDIVRVKYTSLQAIEWWLNGGTKVGQGELGVVRDSCTCPGIVKVTFLMLGTYCMYSEHLVLIQRAENNQAGEQISLDKKEEDNHNL